VVKKYVEALVGLFMLVGLLSFVMLSLKVSGLSQYRTGSFYRVKASFDNIGGLKVRAPVRIAGVRVGEVGAITLNPDTYRAQVVLFLVKDGHGLPSDTAASILTEGLLGANYISLTPGFEQDILKEGGHIKETHSALILENMIGHLLFNVSAAKGNNDKKK